MKYYQVGIQLEGEIVYEGEVEAKNKKEAVEYMEQEISWWVEE